MRRAFTLIELLAVIGIMGLLGVAAAASYGALVNGMKDRSACAAASAVLREADERAHIDRLPTVVYCYNVCLKTPTKTESGMVVGMMTAIRRVGRITLVRGQMLYDEFADLDQTYNWEEESSRLADMRGHRLFKYNDDDDDEMQFSIVADSVYRNRKLQVDTFPGGEYVSTNVVASAFYNLGTGGKHEPKWAIGNGYAMEFAELQLPDGYVFGDNLPKNAGDIAVCKTIRFYPDSDSKQEVEINVTRPDADGVPHTTRKAGSAYADESKGV